MVRVGETSELDLIAVAKLGGLGGGSLLDDGELRSPLLELRVVIAQRAKMLVAKRSAEVAQEYQYERALPP